MTVRYKQHHNRRTQAAIDHHDVAHGFGFVVELIVEHTHPSLKTAHLRKGIIAHIVHCDRAELAALGCKRPKIHRCGVRKCGCVCKEFVHNALHTPIAVLIEHGAGDVGAHDNLYRPFSGTGIARQHEEHVLIKLRQVSCVAAALTCKIIHTCADFSGQRAHHILKGSVCGPTRRARPDTARRTGGRHGRISRAGRNRRSRRLRRCGRSYGPAVAFNQRFQATVKAASDRTEAPVVPFAVNLADNDGAFTGKFSAGIRKTQHFCLS